MINTKQLLKIAIILTLGIVATGCNSLSVSLADVKYGKLYTMQEALDEAANNCADKSARIRALNWATIGYNDLDNSRDYLDKKSSKYGATRALMRDLSLISSRRTHDIEKLCKNFKLVAAVSHNFLANIDNTTQQPVLIAAVQL